MADTAQIPADAGVGLRHPHYQKILAEKPDISWLEVHSENYFGSGGLPHYYLEQIAEIYPLSFHGVGMSIGSADPLDLNHLKRLKEIIEKYKPALVSEHLSWSSIDKRFLNDLLPLPYTKESFANFCGKLSRAQDYLGRQILIENPSSYIRFTAGNIPEWEFFAQVPEKTGCGLLLDINNVYVSCVNHGYKAQDYLNAVNPQDVREYHLAGFARKNIEGAELLIDDHGTEVYPQVWDLFAAALDVIGIRPALMEWDTNIPELEILLGEAYKAQEMINYARANSTALCG